MSPSKGETTPFLQNNYLISGKAPPTTLEEAYSTPKKPKTSFSYVQGDESHLVRRK